MKQGLKTRSANGQPAQRDVSSKGSHKTFLLFGILIGITLVAYLPALRAGFIWDDDDYVTNNRLLLNVSGLQRIWFDTAATPQYYPLVHSSFWLEYRLWGLEPFGFHLVNVLLHALAAVLLWRVLAQLQLPGAWLAAAIFALHPVEVESVAWITERKNVLSALFYFASALVYVRGFAFAANRSVRTSWKSYLAAFLLFVCALFSKTIACSLPAALLLVVWWKNGRLQRRDVFPLLPFFAVGLALGLLTAWLEKHQVGAQGIGWSMTLLQRCLLAGRALWFYAGKIFWPSGLSFNYPRWEIQPDIAWQWLFLLAAGTVVVADHFQYHASVGLFVLSAAGLARLPRFVSIALLAVLCALTWQQSSVYRNMETLWRDTIAKNPGSWMAHNDLGAVLTRKDEKVWHYQEALRLDPGNPEAHNNMGLVFASEGNQEAAIAEYREALQSNPKMVHAYDNIGLALMEQGKLDEAIRYFHEALRIMPEFARVYNDLGKALALQGRTDEAIANFRTAVQLNPRSESALINLVTALGVAGKSDEAIAVLREGIRVNPGSASAHFALGKALMRQRRFNEAIEEYNATLRLLPGHTSARINLAAALAEAGNLPAAVQQFEEALRLDPANPEIHFLLARVLVPFGRREEAAAHLTEALRLKPDFTEAKNALEAVSNSLKRSSESIKSP